MDFDHFMQVLFGGLISILGFFIKMIHAKAEKNQSDLASFKTEVALLYPTADTLEKLINRIDARFDKADEKLERIYLESKKK